MARLDGTVAWLVDDAGTPTGYKRPDGTEGAIAQLATDAWGGVSGIVRQDGAIMPIARADKLRNTGISLWAGAPTAGLFTISGQSGAVVNSEQTSDGGLRVYTATADRYIDLVMALPTASLVKSAALEVKAGVTQGQISVYFAQDSSFTAATMISRSLVVSGAIETHRTGLRQWLWYSGTSSATWTNSGSLNLDLNAFTHFRIRISPLAGQAADATIYGAKINPVGRARIAVISDDGFASWIKYAVPVFQRRGIPTAIGVIPSLVGTNSNYVTEAQLREFVAAGNECLSHGPATGSNLFTGYATDAERLADVVATRDYLVSRGLSGKQQAKCYMWPEGKYQQTQGDRGLMDLMQAEGFTFGRTVTRFLGFNSDLLHGSYYASMTVPIVGYMRQSTEANDTTELNNTVAALQYCAQNGIDCILMLHNVIATQGVWTWTESTDITVDKLVTLADTIVGCRRDYGAETVLLSSFAP